MTNIRKALAGESADRIPLWFMRQAGRYLPEYQEIRKSHSFQAMVKDPEIAAEITLQPVRRFDVDAAIIFSDIMTILEGMGIPVSFEKGAPEIDSPIRKASDIPLWLGREFDFAQTLPWYPEALKLTRCALPAEKSLIGFAGAPFTIASYLIEGKTSKTHALTRAFAASHPDEFQMLLSVLTDLTTSYLKMQVAAGADVVQIFESWGDVYQPYDYERIVLPELARLVRQVSEFVPVIVFCKGASVLRDSLLLLYEAGASALSIDWRLPITWYGNLPVQGNLDPALLMASPDATESAVRHILNARAQTPGFIFNLGHGIYPEARLDSVEAMIRTVREFRTSALAV